MTLGRNQLTEQRFVSNPKINGKAERVIKTIMDLWHQKTHYA
jgi:hypothetical protein